MAVVRHDPWSLLNQFSNEVNRLFEQPRPQRSTDEYGNLVASDWVPPVDIKEETERFVIHADIPGVDPADIDVHMEKGILSISGTRETHKEEEREGFKRTERARGSFLRRFSLPDTADAEKISAKCKNGVLEVVIPKHAQLQPRKIAVEN